MNYWQTFWMIWLVIAGVSFAAITAIVTVKGYEDLRTMFGRLTEQRTEENNE